MTAVGSSAVFSAFAPYDDEEQGRIVAALARTPGACVYAASFETTAVLAARSPLVRYVSREFVRTGTAGGFQILRRRSGRSPSAP